MLVLFLFIFLVFSHAIAHLDKDLGNPCEHDRDCKRAYSYCNPNTKKCTCMKGFETKDCKPVPLCPSNGGGGGIPTPQAKSCQVVVDYSDSGPATHNQVPSEACASHEFCYQHIRTYSGEKNTRLGHCCPKPPADAGIGLTCPESPVTNATCLDMAIYGGGAPIPPELEPLCPMTHECVSQQYRQERICCQNPCIGSNTHINILGQCREIVWFEAECEYSSQCPEKTICRPNDQGKKTCRCKDGFVLDNNPTPHCVPA